MQADDERHREHLEGECMMEEDTNAYCIKVHRPRDKLDCQYIGSLGAEELISHFAHARKMRRQGYTVYRRMKDAEHIVPGEEYYLTWEKEKRGGGQQDESQEPGECQVRTGEETEDQGSSISATLTYYSDSVLSRATSDMREARDHLNFLSDLMERLRVATSHLKRHGPSEREPRVVNLADIECPWVGGRGGVGNGDRQEAHNPAKWETRQQAKILAISQGSQEELPCLGAEDFAGEAYGYTMLAWESWTASQGVRSKRGLIALLPGDKSKQVQLIIGSDPARVVTKEMVLELPARTGQAQARRFAKTVTIVNHTLDPSTPTYEVKHRSEEVTLHMAYAHLIMLDLFSDMAPFFSYF